MKRIIIAILLVFIPLAGFAKNGDGSVPSEKLMSLISEYNGRDGFEVIKIGSFGTSMLKAALKMGASKDEEEDLKQALKLMKGIKKMAIVDYEDASDKVRETFNSRLERLLGSAELLMEMKDGDDCMKIYGIMDSECTQIRNFVMHAPGDGALIYLFGTIQVDEIMEYAAEN